VPDLVVEHVPPARRPTARRWLAAAAWVGTSVGLFAFFLRISRGSFVDSDGANSALQAWALLHGQFLLHGWILGDATFIFLELPVNALTQAIFGLGNLAAHAGSSLTFLFVTICALALAVTGSRGPARAVRCAVVVIVLAAPLLTLASMRLALEEPDHMGTCVFIFGSFLLIDRATERRYAAPLLCVILCAGQLSDLTVRYVAVPAVVLVCGYRALAARKLRGGDAALAAAAILSVPLEVVVRAAMASLGAFSMPSPRAQLSPARLWPHNAVLTWFDVRNLFGAIVTTHTRLGGTGARIGLVCLLAALVGLGRVAWTWRTASRAEQALAVVIVCNIGIYLISVMPELRFLGPHEIVAVLPCGAVLAARAFVPARIRWLPVALAAVASTAAAAVLLLNVAASRPLDVPVTQSLTAWLAAHQLTYGFAGYWDASSATLQSGGQVTIRPVNMGSPIWEPTYEMNTAWYDASRYDATFVVADPGRGYSAAEFEATFGKPAKTYREQGWIILVYRSNLIYSLTPRLTGAPHSLLR
jgi:hypothetical protein